LRHVGRLTKLYLADVVLELALHVSYVLRRLLAELDDTLLRRLRCGLHLLRGLLAELDDGFSDALRVHLELPLDLLKVWPLDGRRRLEDALHPLLRLLSGLLEVAGVLLELVLDRGLPVVP